MTESSFEWNAPETDVGLGTAYERQAIYELFERWLEALPIKNAVEGPVDGMAGIPGLHLLGLARRHVRVKVESPSEEVLRRVRGVYEHLGVGNRLDTKQVGVGDAWSTGFDLALTYNALPFVPDWQTYLRRVAARSSRYVIVSVTNPYSYGTVIRRVMRLAEEDRRAESFDHPSCRPAELERELRSVGRILDHQFLDCPWWPDLFVETGDTLLGGTLRRLPLLRKLAGRNGSPKAGFLYGPDDFPLFDGHPGNAEYRRSVRKHPTFDGRGMMLGLLFGHHHAYLVEKSAS